MTMARFAPGEKFKPDDRGSAYMEFVWKVNEILPGTFGKPESKDDTPVPGYYTEQYETARIVHGPGDEGVRVIAQDDRTAAAFRMAAGHFNIHVG